MVPGDMTRPLNQLFQETAAAVEAQLNQDANAASGERFRTFAGTHAHRAPSPSGGTALSVLALRLMTSTVKSKR